MEYWKNLDLRDINYIDDSGISCEEQWVIVPNFETYLISDLGRIKSTNYLNTGKFGILKQSVSKGGYLHTCLYGKNKRVNTKTHQLVAIGFLNHTPNGFVSVIDHKNNIKTDNRKSNLQIVTSRYNTNKNEIKEGILKKDSWFHAQYDWRPTISLANFVYKLGKFLSLELASEAYYSALDNFENDGILPHREIRIKKYGVTRYKDKWRASIKVDSVYYHIGYFNTEQEAKEARKEVENNLDEFIRSKKSKK